MNLFGRKWRLRVSTIETSDLDLTFQIKKSLDHKPNTATITVFNLSADHRHALEQLNTYKKTSPGKIPVELEAGYEGGMSLIFRGDLRTALSEHDGATWKTTLTGEDGGQAVRWSRVSGSYPAGTALQTVVQDLARAMGVGLGNLTEVNPQFRSGGNTFARGTVLTGSAPDEMRRILRSCGLTYSVQDGVLQVLRNGDALQRTAVRLVPSTGLVGDPVRDARGNIAAKALLIPDLYPGRKVTLEYPELRGTYRVQTIAYDGSTFGTEWYAQLALKDLP